VVVDFEKRTKQAAAPAARSKGEAEVAPDSSLCRRPGVVLTSSRACNRRGHSLSSCLTPQHSIRRRRSSIIQKGHVVDNPAWSRRPARVRAGRAVPPHARRAGEWHSRCDRPAHGRSSPEWTLVEADVCQCSCADKGPLRPLRVVEPLTMGCQPRTAGNEIDNAAPLPQRRKRSQCRAGRLSQWPCGPGAGPLRAVSLKS
jgi:hypothetical protein